MSPRRRCLAVPTVLALASVLGPLAAAAQAAAPAAAAHRNVVAVNPLAAAFQVWQGEYERVVAPTVGAGAGVTHWSPWWAELLSYTSADLRLRWYPRGGAPAGVSLGVVGGYTRVASDVARERAEAVGAGVELNYGELVGGERRLFLGAGVGAKRLFPTRRELRDFRVSYPTWRLAVGWAF